MCVQIHIAAVLYLEMIQGEQIDWFGGFFFQNVLGNPSITIGAGV